MRVRNVVVTVLAGISAVAVPAAAMEVVKPPRPRLAVEAGPSPAPSTAPKPAPAPAPAKPPLVVPEKPAVPAPEPEPAPAPAAKPVPATAPPAPKPAPVVTAKPTLPPATVAPKPAPVEKQSLHLACKAGRPDGVPAVRCEWSGAAGAVRYDLHRKGADGTAAVVSSSDGTSAVDTSVVEGTGYGYGVKALDAGGRVVGYGGSVWVNCCGEATAPVEKQALDLACAAGVPDGAPAVRCEWGAADGAVRYDLYRKGADGTATLVFAGAAPSHVDTAVVEGLAYGYGVKALDAGGRVIGAGGIVEVRCCTPSAG